MVGRGEGGQAAAVAESRRLPQEGSPGLGLKDEKERSRHSGLRGQRKPWGQRVWETHVSQFSFNFRAEGTGQ